MALLGRGAMVATYDVEAGHEGEHDRWHALEHMAERVGIPGFLRGRRYLARGAGRRVFVLYEVEAVSTLVSPAYLERLNNPTAWTRKVMPRFRNMARTLAARRLTSGTGIGGVLQVTELRRRDAGPAPRVESGPEEAIRRWIAGSEDVLGVHLLEGDREASGAPTEEKAIRGTPDVIFDGLLLVERYRPDRDVFSDGMSPELPSPLRELLDGWRFEALGRPLAYRLAQILEDRELAAVSGSGPG